MKILSPNWICSHDSGHIWEEKLPQLSSEQIHLTLSPMRFHSLLFLFPVLALMTLVAPHEARAGITTGLVGHWKFDGDTLDSSGQFNQPSQPEP